MDSKTVYLIFAFAFAIAMVTAYTNNAGQKPSTEILDEMQKDIDELFSTINQPRKRSKNRATYYESCPDSHCICAYTEKGGDVLYEKCNL
ncbi:hypothetical protein HOLleu_22488 [Holothuria leucospilota]|uniref:Uncharacterized protein n=1 Tax=Holothuria leucospilota TaxID=206669 RepID=A0A9Q1H4N6_HOLLE|nr:hypothetical protein HOLleu_22488 [Holothuria leucospilota]